MVSFEVSEKDGCHHLEIGGELSIYSADSFFNEHVKPFEVEKDVLIDLKGVDEIDTAGIQILMVLMQTALAKDLAVKVTSLSESAERYLDLFNLKEKFHIEVM